MRILPVAKTVAINDGGKVLALRRSNNDKDRGGGWDFPGGVLNANESPETAVCREALEEAGIVLRHPRLVWGTTNVHSLGVGIVWLAYLEHLSGTPQVTLSHEHDYYEWFRPEDFLAQNSYQKHHDLFAYLRLHGLLSPNTAPQSTVTARAVICNTKRELLILRRSQTDTLHAGAWDLPGGRMEHTEDPLQTVLRETEEEVGIRLQAPKLVFTVSSPRRIGPWLFYAEHVPDDIMPALSDEHDAYKWIPFADLPQYTDYEILLSMHQFVAAHHVL